MKTSLKALILGLTIFFNRGIMAEHPQDRLSQDWVTIQDEETGIKVDFPHNPLEVTLDLPFQNTPPAGQIRVYSVPTSKGLLALSTWHPSSIKDNELTKEKLYEFFETVLIPHLFFNPAVFHQHQNFEFALKPFEGHPAASFVFSFEDHGVMKKLEGMAMNKEGTLYIPFYLAAKSDFDRQILQRFLKSIQIQKTE